MSNGGLASLAPRAQDWAGELDRVFWDKDGMLLSAVGVATEDYVEHSRYSGRNSYENSIMAMGSLLEATIHKLLITDDARDRDRLARLLASLDGLFRSSGVPGLLFRPHAKTSSVDQMLYCAHAYDLALASHLLPAAQESAIRRNLGDMADYWRRTGYAITNIDGRVGYLGERDEPLMTAFQALDAAHNRSGAARRALDELLSRNTAGLLASSVAQARAAGQTHVAHPYVPQMYIYTIDILHRYGMLAAALAKRGYQSWVDGQANYSLVGNPQDSSGLPFSGQTFLTIVYDGQTDTAGPPAPGKFTGRALGDAWHVAYVNAAAYGCFQDRAYLDRAAQILRSCSKALMRWSVTDNPGELEANSVFTEVCDWYNGYGIAGWLQTYWLLRRLENR